MGDNSGASYYRARYYDPQAGRFVGEDPIVFRGGVNFYTYVHNRPLDFFDVFGLRDYNEQETAEWLRVAYGEATAGRIKGLQNIYMNSTGKYDFGMGFNPHRNDTWARCGIKMNADQFGNYMAGFEGGAYDHYYLWTTGGTNAEAMVELAGIYYHRSGKSKASKTDPWDRTGRPDIGRGEDDGWNFAKNNGKCSCDPTQ